jgi:hypothetical protein
MFTRWFTGHHITEPDYFGFTFFALPCPSKSARTLSERQPSNQSSLQKMQRRSAAEDAHVKNWP